MRPQRTVRKLSSSTSNRGRAALVANSLDLVGEWWAHRRKTGDSINATVEALLEQVDFDHVRPGHLLESLRVLLAGLPTGALADVSTAANAERRILAERVGDRELGLTDEQLIARMSPSDQRLVRVLDELRGDPEAFRAAMDLVKAFGRADRAGLDVGVVFGREGVPINSDGTPFLHQHRGKTSCAETSGELVATDHDLQAGTKPRQSISTPRAPGQR